MSHIDDGVSFLIAANAGAWYRLANVGKFCRA